MIELTYSLVSDGSSDVALLPLLSWLLRENGVKCAVQARLADLRRLPDPPRDLRDKIRLALDLYPCDLLFVHRDAEKQSLDQRKNEIHEAINAPPAVAPPWVCVIPIRMTEAWLLFDETAIRHAAGNRSGRQSLALPGLMELESLPDPKTVLHELLRQASGLHGRRLKQFRATQSALRVSSLITDFSPLRQLSAFRTLESALQVVIESAGWAIAIGT
ncbi:MAG: DUF4276 family protein [Anaerolinea sp.]|nr:DUF4276 family protein [Anaerolinea sp.]